MLCKWRNVTREDWTWIWWMATVGCLSRQLETPEEERHIRRSIKDKKRGITSQQDEYWTCDDRLCSMHEFIWMCFFDQSVNSTLFSLPLQENSTGKEKLVDIFRLSFSRTIVFLKKICSRSKGNFRCVYRVWIACRHLLYRSHGL